MCTPEIWIVQPGDHVITTDLEHNSISRPLRAMEKAGVIALTRVASEAGYVDPDAIRRALTPSRSETTLDNLMCASSSSASNRFWSWTRFRVS